MTQKIDKKVLQERTKSFAHRCLKLCLSLPDNWIGQHIRNQLLRCATSVAANYRSACMAQSAKAFTQKLGISLEEADEASFWIEFVVEEGFLDKKHCLPLLQEARELTAIFIASQKTARKNAILKTDMK
jgi:four helix bundle protein